MRNRGFTVVELLAAMFVAAVMLVILATATSGQGRAAVFQIGTADVTQNLRAGIDLFTRELRMAGYGMAAVPTNVLAPVEVQNTADPVSVVLRGNFSNVRSNGSATASTVTIDPTAACALAPTSASCAFTVGRQLAVYSEMFGVAEVRTITAYNAAAHQITLSADLAQVYDPGSPLNQIDALTYRLDANGVLWRGTDPVADQMNVLQLAYVLLNGTSVGDPAGNLATLRSATLRMHAQKAASNGLQPQADFLTEVRIRNLGITSTASL